MNRKVIKTVIIAILCILISSVFYTCSAGVVDQFNGEINPTATTGASKIRDIMALVLEIIRNVGAGLAVLIIIVIGCKYIIASAGERADIKKNAVPYVIGVVVLFASSGIAGILKEFATNATKATAGTP
jgi:type IV secretory pathway VirB2 component (pilin)